jgi:hypothetical protein
MSTLTQRRPYFPTVRKQIMLRGWSYVCAIFRVPMRAVVVRGAC